METAEIKNELHDKIDHADPKQLEQLYGLVLNYFNGQDVIGGDDDELTEGQKDRINKSLEQARAGLVEPVSEVNKSIREKLKLNGQRGCYNPNCK